MSNRPIVRSACAVSVLSCTPIDDRAAVSVAPLEAAARFSLRLRATTAAEFGGEFALPLNIPINTCIATHQRTIARLGPDEWLILALAVERDALLKTMETALGARCYSLVDISQRQTGIGVAGRYSREVINSGCPLDLHEDAFPAVSATRTLLGKAEIVLLRTGQPHTFRVECWRSFGPYVLAFLKDAAREFV